MPIRPEAERRLRAGFQRRVDEQARRYAGQLAHARELAGRLGYGEVTGVFAAQAGGRPVLRTFVVGLLPLAALPLLIAAAAAGLPGLVPVLFAFPFVAGAWIGLSFWLLREPPRRVWLYAFTEGFVLDDPPAGAGPVRWSQVTAVGETWTTDYLPGDEDGQPVLIAYRLQLADGRACEVSRTFQNVQDPYGEIGQLFRGLAPGTVGKTMPRFPTIDEIIATYTGKARPGAARLPRPRR